MPAGRNALEIYDPALARKQEMLAEPHKYASSGTNMPRQAPPPLSPDIQKKLMDALAKEGQKLRQREEERRRRDPSYRPDAIELSNANLREFDKYTDYYERLDIDQFASAGEIKNAYKKLSLELHPDKQGAKTEAERAAVKERFLKMTEAHAILSDLATRREYDKQRDHMDARNDAGLLDVGKMSKPPPTCVDVEVSLEQLFRGTRKQVHFTRNEFAGTRWAKKTHDDYNVKVNRGELEGAAIWYKSAGDVGPFGRSDLVCVVKQEPHSTFERLGDDLWYYSRSGADARHVFFCSWVPTMSTTKSSAKHPMHPSFRRVAAVGCMLDALLGFDRSGLGEALVLHHGMPLNPRSAEEATDGRTKGDLVVKFPIKLPERAHRLCIVGGLLMPPIGLLTADTATGLLPASATDVFVRTTVVPHVLIRLHTDREHQRFLRAQPVSPRYPPPLPGDDPLPDLEAHTSSPRLDAYAAPRRVLTAVCLLVGGGDHQAVMAAPSVATDGLMQLLSATLPQLEWHIVWMTDRVSEPLLADEVDLIEHAAILVLEALPDCRADRQLTTCKSMPVSIDDLTDAPTRSPATSIREAREEKAASWVNVREWVIVYEPGVRVRIGQPSSSAQSTAVALRTGARVTGSLVPCPSHDELWIQLTYEGMDDGGSAALGTPHFVQCMCGGFEPFARPYQASSEREGAVMTEQGGASPSGDNSADADGSSKPAAVQLHAQQAQHASEARDETSDMARSIAQRDRDDQAIADAEAAEDTAWEAEAATDRECERDEMYLEAGCGAAAALMHHPYANSLLRCHCNGGIVLAVGLGCTLLGHTARRQYSARVEAIENESRLSLSELEIIRDELMADDIPINLPKMRLWSESQARAYFENNGVLPPGYELLPSSDVKSGDGTSVHDRLSLPFVISVTSALRSVSDMDGWRGLRAATLHARTLLEDEETTRCGFSAIGLPSASVVTVLTTHGFAVRAALGSAQLHKISLRKVMEEASRREERLAKAKAERARMAVLREIREELSARGTNRLDTLDRAIEQASKSGGVRDNRGVRRRQCMQCHCCMCYTRPVGLSPGSKLHGFCGACGCVVDEHEELL